MSTIKILSVHHLRFWLMKDLFLLSTDFRRVNWISFIDWPITLHEKVIDGFPIARLLRMVKLLNRNDINGYLKYYLRRKIIGNFQQFFDSMSHNLEIDRFSTDLRVENHLIYAQYVFSSFPFAKKNILPPAKLLLSNPLFLTLKCPKPLPNPPIYSPII